MWLSICLGYDPLITSEEEEEEEEEKEEADD